MGFSAALDQKPVFQYLEVKSIRIYRHGTLINGVNHTYYEKRELMLDVYDHPFSNRGCTDCKKPIKKLDVYGSYGPSYPHCIKCVEMPAGVEAWEVTYRMKRKSKQHPDGMLMIRRVQFPTVLEAYFAEYDKIYDRVKKRKIWTSPTP